MHAKNPCDKGIIRSYDKLIQSLLKLIHTGKGIGNPERVAIPDIALFVCKTDFMSFFRDIDANIKHDMHHLFIKFAGRGYPRYFAGILPCWRCGTKLLSGSFESTP